MVKKVEYSEATRNRALKLINELAPLTRRDEWWKTEGPFEIVAKHIEEHEEETR